MMGNLLGRKIVQSRVYDDPNLPDMDDLGYDFHFTYPITVFKAVLTDMSDNAHNLEQIIEKLEDQIAHRQLLLPVEPTEHLVVYPRSQPGKIGKLPVRRVFQSDPDARSSESIVTEKAIGAYIDTKVPLIVYNNHVKDVKEGNVNIHITDDEREYWNSMTPLAMFRKHLNDGDVHITPEEREKWNKFDHEKLDNHINNFNNPHRTTASQVGTYTRDEIEDRLEQLRPKFFVYKNIYWHPMANPQFGIDYYKHENWNPNYFFEYGYPYEQLPSHIYGSRLFALIPEETPEVDSVNGKVAIYFQDINKPWEKVATVTLENGDLFLMYPTNWIYIFVGRRFMRINTTLELTANVPEP